MKAIHLTAYGDPAQSLKMVEVSELNAPIAGEALVRMDWAVQLFATLAKSGERFLGKTSMSPAKNWAEKAYPKLSPTMSEGLGTLLARVPKA